MYKSDCLRFYIFINSQSVTLYGEERMIAFLGNASFDIAGFQACQQCS